MTTETNTNNVSSPHVPGGDLSVNSVGSVVENPKESSAVVNGKELPINEHSNAVRKCTVCGKEGKLVVSYSWKYPDGSKFIYDMRCYQHLRRFDKPAASDKHDRNAPCSCGSGKKFKKCCSGKEAKV